MDKSEKVTLTFTAEEVFILQCALESFADNDDSAFKKAVKMSNKLHNRLPDTGLEFSDVM